MNRTIIQTKNKKIMNFVKETGKVPGEARYRIHITYKEVSIALQ
jgi:hypothetical protein